MNVGQCQSLNYFNHIKPIIETHCMPCHQKENIGAMPLTTYDEVKSYARMIGYVTEKRLMPPFKANVHYSDLKYSKSLDSNHISILKNWYATGMKMGAEPKFSENNKVSDKVVPKKDLISFAMNQRFEIAGDNEERSRVFVIQTSFNEDLFASQIEFVPGSKKLIKNCFISIDTGNVASEYDGYDKEYGYYGLAGVAFNPYAYFWYEWTPDAPQWQAQIGFAKKIPKGSKLLFHIFYKASTIATFDSSHLNVKLINPLAVKKTIKTINLIDTSDIVNKPFVIRPHEKIRFLSTKKIDKDIELHAVIPCGQNACTGWEVFAIDGITKKRINILKIENWDAHWLRKYEFKYPIKLSAGSIINSETFYNNDDDNNNLTILPPKKIVYGEGSRMEMYKLFVDVTEGN